MVPVYLVCHICIMLPSLYDSGSLLKCMKFSLDQILFIFSYLENIEKFDENQFYWSPSKFI